MPGGDLNFSRYSSLSQINRSNIKSLGGAWAVELGAEVSNSAMVAQDGVMYFHTQQQVLALDAKTGGRCGVQPTVPFNGSARDVTVAGGLVFAGLSDTSVVALRADTGDPAWIYKGADVAPGNGYIVAAGGRQRRGRGSRVGRRRVPSRPHHRRRRQDREGTVDVLRRSGTGRSGPRDLASQ